MRKKHEFFMSGIKSLTGKQQAIYFLLGIFIGFMSNGFISRLTYSLFSLFR